MEEAQTETPETAASEPTPAEVLMGECRALLDHISKVSGIPVVQAQETAPANVAAATAKTPDGKDVPALVIQMDRAALHAAALYAVLRDAGIVAVESVELAVLRVKRDILAEIAAKVEAQAAEASNLTIAKGPPLVLPAGANRAARRGQVTPVRR